MTANKIATWGAIAMAGVALWYVAGPKVKAAMGKAKADQAARAAALADTHAAVQRQWQDLATVAISTLDPTLITGF